MHIGYCKQIMPNRGDQPNQSQNQLLTKITDDNIHLGQHYNGVSYTGGTQKLSRLVRCPAANVPWMLLLETLQQKLRNIMEYRHNTKCCL